MRLCQANSFAEQLAGQLTGQAERLGQGLLGATDLVREAGAGIVQTVQAVGGLIGTLMTIYGRVRATKPLAQRSMQVKL